MPKWIVNGVVFVLIPNEDNPKHVPFSATVVAKDFVDAMRVWDRLAGRQPGAIGCKSDEIVPAKEEVPS